MFGPDISHGIDLLSEKKLSMKEGVQQRKLIKFFRVPYLDFISGNWREVNHCLINWAQVFAHVSLLTACHLLHIQLKPVYFYLADAFRRANRNWKTL